MKLKLFITSLVVLLGIFVLPVMFFVRAQGAHVVLEKNQIINKDYLAAGESVILSGTVNGDAYLAGGTMVVEGIINGDLLAAGGTITIRGKVTNNIRVIGGQVTIAGDIGRNVTVAGGSVTIDPSAQIHGSLVAGAGSLSIFAPIGREANFGAGQATIGSSITGDVAAGVGQLTLTPQGSLAGNLTYWSETKAQLNPGSQIAGTVTYHYTPQANKSRTEMARKSNALKGIAPAFNIISFLAALVIGLLLIKFTPVYAQQTADIILQKPFQALGVGFLAIVAAPFAFILLLVTLIGIPLDLILLSVFFIMTYLAKIFVGIALGQKGLSLFNKKTSLGWVLVAGLLAYYILAMIPVIGFIFWMVAGLIGLGAILIEKKHVYTQLSSKKLI